MSRLAQLVHGAATMRFLFAARPTSTGSSSPTARRSDVQTCSTCPWRRHHALPLCRSANFNGIFFPDCKAIGCPDLLNLSMAPPPCASSLPLGQLQRDLLPRLQGDRMSRLAQLVHGAATMRFLFA